MTTNISLENIQALARTIHAETGLYVSYMEDMHPSARSATVSIQHLVDDAYWHEWFKGFTRPGKSENTLEEIERQLADWLVAYRKQREGTK